MAGKTTFIRTVGLNAVLAQTIHMCTARAYRAPLLRIQTFINRRDNLFEGQSYFYTEVLAIKELLDEAARPQRSLFIIDELFKGTNTEERLAASKAVLDHLNQGNHFVFASTHDLELIEMLEEEWTFYHFCEDLHDDRLVFDYRIRPGQSSAHNALRLLTLAGIPAEVVQEAVRVKRSDG